SDRRCSVYCRPWRLLPFRGLRRDLRSVRRERRRREPARSLIERGMSDRLSRVLTRLGERSCELPEDENARLDLGDLLLEDVVSDDRRGGAENPTPRRDER